MFIIKKESNTKEHGKETMFFPKVYDYDTAKGFIHGYIDGFCKRVDLRNIKYVNKTDNMAEVVTMNGNYYKVTIVGRMF